MRHAASYFSIGLTASLAHAQQVGYEMTENHPLFPWSSCTASGCTTIGGSLTLDADRRWVHDLSGTTNCYTGNEWNVELCPDGTVCALNCALEGADYTDTYGVATQANSLQMTLRQSNFGPAGARVFLLANSTSYNLIHPINRQISITVDASNLPCAVSGAIRLVQMDSDGGMAKYSTNHAGAKYGTGYCTASCRRDLKFINGQANVNGWTPSDVDPTTGTGLYGSCCNEFDLLEGNTASQVFAAYPCSGAPSQTRCSGSDCGASSSTGSIYEGLCDPIGCDFNSYRMGDPSFFGLGKTVDSSQLVTIVTQFVTDDGTDDGELVAIKRFFVQRGVVVANANVNIPGMDPVNYLSPSVCSEALPVFGYSDSFTAQGGFSRLTNAFKAGVVLAFEIYEDPSNGLLWLDSDWPPDDESGIPGVARGTCPTDWNTHPVDPEDPTPSVVFSNLQIGPIDPTYTPV